MRLHFSNHRLLTILELGFFSLLFVCCLWLMFHTFRYNVSENEMVLGSKVWSDFGAHIPLIRSFSLGSNWPPEYPLFPGEKIKYHFLFYSIVGLLEKIGVRIDYALNIPSALGLFLLLVLLYKLAVLLFQRRSVGVLTIVFFFFNGSLSFINYFNKHDTILGAIKNIPSVKDFPSFGPWDHSLVTAFTNLNVYTNQRHLAASFALVMAIIILLLSLQRKKHTSNYIEKIFPVVTSLIPVSVCIGLLFSLLLFLNQAALVPAVIFAIGFFLFHPPSRVSLIIGFFISIPWIVLFYTIAQTGGTPVFEPGYLSEKPLAIKTFLEFWMHNLGLHILLFPIGMILAPKRIRWLALPVLVIFLLPNIYRFSTDMINNHKFINLFTICISLYSSYALVLATEWFTKQKTLRLFLVTIPLLFIILTLSGLIDFFAIKNDYTISLTDIPKNKDATFIRDTIPKDAIILNSTWFYHPASTAGRKIYNGYAFFTWSAGYDTYKRESLVKEIFQSEDKIEVCQLLNQEHISYVEVNNSPEEFLKPISPLWKNQFSQMYSNSESGITIYSVSSLCK